MKLIIAVQVQASVEVSEDDENMRVKVRQINRPSSALMVEMFDDEGKQQQGPAPSEWLCVSATLAVLEGSARMIRERLEKGGIEPTFIDAQKKGTGEPDPGGMMQ